MATSPVNLSLSQRSTARHETSEIRTLGNWPKLRSLIDKAGQAILNEFAVIYPDAFERHSTRPLQARETRSPRPSRRRRR